jgi:V0 complex accessory subunit Ac45/VOA1 transmembrane domain
LDPAFPYRSSLIFNLVSTLSDDLRGLSNVFRSYAVIISGSVATRPAKRDVVAVDVRTPFFLPRVSPSTFIHNRLVADNSTLPAGGILKRYQLLTPGLLLTLIIALLLLFPIVFVGISALANIKSPQRMEAPKVDRRG